MPPPPPDRRDFLYRDGRRHDGGGGDPLPPPPPPAPTPPRWRDSPYHPPPPPALRDHSRPSPRRTPSSASSEGYYRQGGGAYERSYPDEPLGFTPSRSDRYWLEDDGGGAGYKGFGRYGGGGGGRRDGRDIRGSYRRSPFRNYGGSDFSRSHQEHPPPPLRRSPLRSVAVPISYDPPGDRADRGDRDQQPRVTPWRPLRQRESRSDAADAAGVGPVSLGQTTAAAASEKEAPIQSSDVLSPRTDDEAPRKKARLGWGQGLAKYEKQKVQVSAEPAEAIGDRSPADLEHKAGLHAPAAAVPCTSPVTCQSPAPPSSSPVPEDKSCELTVNTVAESNKDVPGTEVHARNDEVPIKLDQLDGDPIGSLANVITGLLQHDDSCSGDSKRLTSASKLLLLKESITKELEKTELEIDALEGELKSVTIEAGNIAVRGSSTVVTCARNPSSPSNGTSKVAVSTCETASPAKEQGEITPSPKTTEELDADINGVELMEVDAAPIHNAKMVSSEESVAFPGVADAQIPVTVDVIPLKPLEEIGSQVSARQKANSCHDNVSSMKADGSDALSMRACSYHADKYNIIPSVLAMNNGIAKEASELLFKALSADQPSLDLLASSCLSSQRKSDLIIKQKLAICKNNRKFKEQILTFKFKVLRYLWKEDVRLLSVRKQRSKSNKRTDQSNRTSQCGSQRQRSLNRSRLTMPVGNLNTYPITEISDVANRLFSEFQFKRCRNYLKMPALIIDKKEKAAARFISKNALIEDPVSVEKERAMINPWTQDEKQVFMEMLARFGKDFSKISSYLQHKTTADCVEFYYKHHKSDSFREVKKLLDLRQRQQPTGNFLGAKSGKKWNPEANAASLDMLGVASAVAAQGIYENRGEKISSKSIIRAVYGSSIPLVTKGSTDKDCIGNVPLHERESVAADILAGICGTVSPEGMGSCITSSADPGQKISITRMGHLLTPEADKGFGDEGTLSDQECEVDPVDWNDNEKLIFIEAINNYGKDFARISSCVKSKSYEQCKVFFSKARKSLGLDMIHQGTVDAGLRTSDTNGGRSGDTDEACAAEMDSAACSTQSCSKMEMDVCPAADGAIQGHPLSVATSKQPEADGSNGPDAVNVKVEEGVVKADTEPGILVDHKQLSEDNQQTSCAPIDINCPESTGNPQNTEDVKQVTGNGSVISSTEQAALEMRSSLRSVELIKSSKASEEICTEVSRVEASSSLPHSTESEPAKSEKSTPSVCLPVEGGSKENVPHFSNMTGVSSIGPAPAFTSGYQHTLSADLPPSKPKPQVAPLTSKDLMPVQFNSVLPDPTSIRFEGIASITTPNFEDHGNEAGTTNGAKDTSRFPAYKDQPLNQLDGFRNTDGFMQQMRNHHISTDPPLFSASTANATMGISQSDHFTLPKFQNGRSSSSGLSNGAVFQNGRSSISSLSNGTAGISWTGDGVDVREGSLMPCSNMATAESDEHVKRSGDVKLFGQILSHQSTLQKSGSTSSGSKSKPCSPKSDRSTGRLLNGSRDCLVYSSRPVISAHLGPEERAVKSFSHLDGSTVQSEPVRLVAKCQRSLTGVPFYSAKNGTLGMFTEYQQPLMQQFQSDPNLQKRNGMELISGFQQPGKGSRLGGTGILVSGVSDPVAALKAQYGPGSKIVSNDVDAWKGIGNR